MLTPRSSGPKPRLVAAPDKFKGTATASEVADAICAGAVASGWDGEALPLADGGEGTLAALGGANRHTVVTNPLGDPVTAGWRLDGGTAVIEMAEASGLALVGGAGGNDALAASTYGTGELLEAALERGARRVIVCVGGSATTDGGFGAVRALLPGHRLRGVELIVACDVRTRFCDAADVFGPQKGATPAQVELLRRRLERLAGVYLAEHGVDVTALAGAGAAGGLAGGLAALGGRIVEGFEVVAEEVRLAERLEGADLVITGEGRLDAGSFDGKVVGGVTALAQHLGVPAVAIVGEVAEGAEMGAGTDADGDADAGSAAGRDRQDRIGATPVVDSVDTVDADDESGAAGEGGDSATGDTTTASARHRGLTVLSLSERFGPERARHDTAACIEHTVTEFLDRFLDRASA